VEQGLGEWPPVGLDDPGDDVGAPAAPALALGQHGVGLANARGRAQVDSERADRLDLAGGICVRLRGAAHASAGLLGAGAPSLLGDLARLPPLGAAWSGPAASIGTRFLITSRLLSILAVPAGFAGDGWRVAFLIDSVWIGTVARPPCLNRARPGLSRRGPRGCPDGLGASS